MPDSTSGRLRLFTPPRRNRPKPQPGPVARLEPRRSVPGPAVQRIHNGSCKAARSGAKDFETRWKGGLEQAAATVGDTGRGIEAYEELEELMGRIISYAGLTYFTDSADPAKAKFYGDVQSAITDISAHLLFFALELNRIDD
jgi:hypothetical protein